MMISVLQAGGHGARQTRAVEGKFRWETPGRKFCTSTSARVAGSRVIFAASGRLRSSDSERLPRFVETNSAENSPTRSPIAGCGG
jgi:hypothetical protein